MNPRPLEIARKAARAAEEKKSANILILDLGDISPITDYFVICSVASEIQGRAVADHIRQELSRRGVEVWQVEGYDNAKWILLDYVDVVIHVFEEETRDFYGLDRLWGDAPQVSVKAAKRRTRE